MNTRKTHRACRRTYRGMRHNSITPSRQADPPHPNRPLKAVGDCGRNPYSPPAPICLLLLRWPTSRRNPALHCSRRGIRRSRKNPIPSRHVPPYFRRGITSGPPHVPWRRPSHPNLCSHRGRRRRTRIGIRQITLMRRSPRRHYSHHRIQNRGHLVTIPISQTSHCSHLPVVSGSRRPSRMTRYPFSVGSR